MPSTIALAVGEPTPESPAAPARGLRQLKREARIEQILASSRRVFTEIGYAGYSMRKVADDAGLHLNTIQHFFGDVDALLMRTIHSVLSDYTVRFKQIADLHDLPARDRLEAIIDELLRDATNPDIQAFTTQAWTVALRHEPIARMLRDLYLDYENVFASLIRELAPDRSATEVRIQARLMAAWIEGFGLTSRYAPPEPPIAPVAARLKSLCLSLFGTSEAGMPRSSR